MEFNKEDLVKSPLNYVGGKFKLLPQILPYFPDNIDTFYDIFAGGCNVSVNVKAKKIICNDLESAVINLFINWKELGSSKSLIKLKETINKYKLSKTNEEGYKSLREDYNNGNKSWDMFYSMLVHSFNNHIRFNKKGDYNVAFGKNRSSFNPNLQKNFIKFINKLEELNIYFINNDFRRLNINELNKNDFLYLDPPYFITCANYNERNGWNQQDDIDLMNLCDNLNFKGIKFALSNVLENKGKSNDILKEWSKKYNVYHLNNTYGNCSYNTKDKSSNSTDEVLITNY